jgi:hypothetical protein
MITAVPISYFTSDPAILSDNIPSGFDQLDDPSQPGYGNKFWCSGHIANLTF